MGIRIKKVKNRANITKKFARHSYHKIEDIINLIKSNKNINATFKINKINIKTSTRKNNLFVSNFDKWKGKCKCEICKLEASYFVLEKSHTSTYDKFHFNLYTIDKKTKQEIYFNSDHIQPKSKGGVNRLENLQLTCERCNTLKSNHYNNFKHWLFMLGVKIRILTKLFI